MGCAVLVAVAVVEGVEDGEEDGERVGGGSRGRRRAGWAKRVLLLHVVGMFEGDEWANGGLGLAHDGGPRLAWWCGF